MKLEFCKVEEMRWERWRYGTSYRVLAEKHGVTRKAAGNACRGKTWKHAGGPIAESAE